MGQPFKKIWASVKNAKTYSIRMQRKLILYWLCMILTAFVAEALILGIIGVIPEDDQKLGEALNMQQQNVTAMLSRQMDTLAAQGITLSEKITRELEQILIRKGITFDELNDNAELIAEVESSLYGILETVLKSSACSGTFFILDATVNTQAENADISRMGVYLRFSDLKAVGTANQRMVYFRGAADVARREQIQMHNRWNLEFDTSLIPGYDTLMGFSGNRLSQGCLWSERMQLRGTWEDALLLCIPIVDSSGRVLGICGMELSDLYFTLSYPVSDSPYGNMVTLLAPMEDNKILLDKAMIGNSAGTYLLPEGYMEIKSGRYYTTCLTETYSYLGVYQPLSIRSASSHTLIAMTLISESSFRQFSTASQQKWLLASLGFLLLLIGVSLFLSKRFVSPIVHSIKEIKEKGGKENSSSGISEIDELIAFIHSRNNQEISVGELPPDIEELLRDFLARVQTLTPSERALLQLYLEGYDIHEAAEQAFISIGTARKHNTNINRNLGVSNREELMLYFDLFRRCDRLDELTYHR